MKHFPSFPTSSGTLSKAKGVILLKPTTVTLINEAKEEEEEKKRDERTFS